MAEERDTLIVQSKVRDAIKAKAGEAGVRTSDEFLAALNELVHEAIEKAISRAKENGRSTLRKQDV
jgi:histone H3/H4